MWQSPLRASPGQDEHSAKSADERARDLYERREKARRDMAAQQKWAIKKSMFEVARNAWQMNMPIGDIVKLTGLTVEEVESQCIKQ